MWARSPTYSDLDPGQLLISSGVGGSNWREHELPRWLRLYETPTCSSSAECFAAGWDAGEPGVALTVDGGASWSFEAASASWRAVSADGWRITSMSCSTATNCIAVAAGTSTGNLAVLRFSDIPSSDR